MFNLLNLLKKNAWGIGFLFVTVLLVVTVVACGPAGPAGPTGPAGKAGPAGPAGKAGPDGVAGRSAGEGGPSMSATIAGGKLIIAGSGFPAGKGIWLNIPGAAAEGRDVFLTTDLAIVNASGAFAVTLDMSKPPIGGKGGLKPGVYSIKSVGGDVVAVSGGTGLGVRGATGRQHHCRCREQLFLGLHASHPAFGDLYCSCAGVGA